MLIVLNATTTNKVANPNGTSTAKKLRRKKTLAELKEEENLLLQERRSLTNELASLRATVEKHRATNESLKRMKLDLELRQNFETATTTFDVSGKAVLDRPHFMEAQFIPSSSLSPKIVTPKVPDNDSLVCAANASSKPQENGNQEIPFALPDLNLPVDDDFSTSAMH
ncbi:hypothetical protein RIF29_28318 [Crotalaria pallida]|uniref:Uncharacterized protein n=1 Tax=Crotalaria pallida TaxID=3830 RepID=A0AAN9ET26_CROPI